MRPSFRRFLYTRFPKSDSRVCRRVPCEPVRNPAFLAYRHQLPQLLAARGYTGTGVEIGVQRGLYSELILSGSHLSRLILVDPWREFESYEDIANVVQAEQDNALADARARLAKFGDRAEFWRMPSLEAAPLIEDRSLDFIYIDARHDYASMLEDLTAWFPKIKPRGLFAGHDYVDGTFPEGDFGVRSAVDEFCAQHRFTVYSTYAETAWSTWIAAPGSDRPQAIAAVRTALGIGVRTQRKITHIRRTGRWA
jgi:hypothetical protein